MCLITLKKNKINIHAVNVPFLLPHFCTYFSFKFCSFLLTGGHRNVSCPRAPGTLATRLSSPLEIFLPTPLNSLPDLLNVGCGLVSQNLAILTNFQNITNAFLGICLFKFCFKFLFIQIYVYSNSLLLPSVLVCPLERQHEPESSTPLGPSRPLHWKGQ